jgi:hypothetical protein
MSERRTPTPPALRDHLARALVRHLVGPTGADFDENEDLQDSPGSRYFLGLLAPKRPRGARTGDDADRLVEDEGLATAGAGTADDDGDDDADGGGGPEPNLRPSSFGLSFCLEPGVTALRVTARWASYRREPGPVVARDEGDQAPGTNLVWRRYPLTATLDIELEHDGEIAKRPAEPSPCPAALGVPPRVFVQGRVAALPGHGGVRVVTLFLVNETPEADTLRDQAWLFQPELSVEHPSGQAIFVPRPLTVRPADADATLAMHDRATPELCVGLGVGAHAERVDAPGSVGQRAKRLTTRVVPQFEVGQQTPRRVSEDAHLAGLELDMKTLGELPTPALMKALWPLPNAYSAFLDEQQARLARPDAVLAKHKAAAQAAIEDAKRARDRIHEGIALLGGNEQAADAFRFANTAMYHQRIQSRLANARREHRRQSGLAAHLPGAGKPRAPSRAGVDLPENRRWYPFQLGFILLNLPGLTNLHHADRSPGGKTQPVCDLLFFPTGGGKTEAYLGLTAYTLAIRRLQGVVFGRDGRRGLGVLMRYTLRLLTLQQFQRAAALICACEVERRKDAAKWGSEPFRIGLWVGQRTTPNKTSQSDEVLKELRHVKGAGVIGVGSPAQLTSCPWCGDPLDPKANYIVDLAPGGLGRTLVYCTRVGDDPCLFTQRAAPDEGLPIIVVDEELYRRPPALLIATVDKFAQMPWRGEIQTLFGRVAGECPRHGFQTPSLDDAQKHPAAGHRPAVSTQAHLPLRPPDLIIQDELHLISGPLGTLTALYETAVDALCTWENSGSEVRPKVIAATATIKQAREQIRSVFAREARIFPPPGLDAGESFFARLRDPAKLDAETYAPGRLYLGICAPGRRLKAALIRVYTACMAAAQSLYLEYGADADAWMTLVGYFNSLRELAGMRRLVDDDVRARLRQTDRVGFARRPAPFVEEMTSRKNSRDIPDLLDLLNVPFDPGADERRKALGPEARRSAKRPLDVLLATNMISVGVDIERLGLMVVAGQPKSMAEYIQATSRVGRGRKSPGLVLTVYNWARPRDLSHYERFEQDHATFYQRVEPLSVTPFAPRALDRGLSATWVAMLRLGDLDWNDNKGAARFDPDDPRVARALEAFRRRVATAEGAAAAEALVQGMIAKRRDEWTHATKPTPGHGTIGYSMEKDGVTRGLLSELGQGGLAKAGTFACPLSLRNVEPTVRLILQDLGQDTQEGTT